jgi:ubiquinone/menaquinone biosynthesis C-methylase UbiE
MPDKDKVNSPITWNPKNLFSGTAWYYSRYRPGWPDNVFQVLKNKFRLDHLSRVLDLGCGTGQVALPVAALVSEVIAIDPQEEMLKEASLLAAAKSLENIRWLQGESGDLSRMAALIGKIDLTVIARAFHWMDKKQTLNDLYAMTVPGGGIAIISDSGPRDGPKPHWKKAIDKVVKRWLGEERRAGTEGTFSSPAILFETVLKDSLFRKVETALIHMERTWDIDRIIGYLYSTSSSSIPVLGDKKGPFEAAMRAALKEAEPSGQLKESVTIEILMAWKSVQGDPLHG